MKFTNKQLLTCYHDMVIPPNPLTQTNRKAIHMLPVMTEGAWVEAAKTENIC